MASDKSKLKNGVQRYIESVKSELITLFDAAGTASGAISSHESNYAHNAITTALQPAAIASGTITPKTGDIDFNNLGSGEASDAMSEAEALAGTETTPRIVAAAVLKSAIQTHSALTIRAVSTTTTAVAFEHLIITSSGSNYTIELPENPSTNDVVALKYVQQTPGDVITIDRNGKTINRLAGDIKLYVADQTSGKLDSIELVYDGVGWVITRDDRVPHRAELYMTADEQSVVGSPQTNTVPFDSVRNDNVGMGNTTEHTLTVKRTGQYLVAFSIVQKHDSENAMLDARVVNAVNGDILVSGPRLFAQPSLSLYRPLTGALPVMLTAGQSLCVVTIASGGTIRDIRSSFQLVEQR
jgi:hypothetical protein